MNNKVIFVKAHFRPVYNKVGLLKKMLNPDIAGTSLDVPEGLERKDWSDCLIDGERLANDINIALEKLELAGYELSSINPITSGQYKYDNSTIDNASFGYGYGYSFTEGVIISAKKSA